MDYSNNFFNFSNKEYIHNVYLTCQVNLTYNGPSSAPATSDFGSNFVQWNGLIANYVSQNWNNINSTDSYLITARDMSYLPPDLNNAVGITYYNAQNYSLIGRPSFILCDRITGGYKEIDILRCITHEIGHKRKINGHNCSTDCDGCCVMEPSLPFTCTHYPSSFHFCKEHKCTIYLNDF